MSDHPVERRSVLGGGLALGAGLVSSAAKAQAPGRTAARYDVGFLDGIEDKDPVKYLLRAFRDGLGGLDADVTIRKKSAKYGKKHPGDLDDAADDLVLRQNVNLIVACGGLVSAYAAARAANKRNPPPPVLICVGQVDPGDPLLQGANVTGFTLNTPSQNQKRADILVDRHHISAANIWLIVNSNSAMGLAERNAWNALRRPFADTGGNGENDEAKLGPAFQYAVSNGAEGFIISGDPFFTSAARTIISLVKGTQLPTCYPFREYIDVIDAKYVSYGPNLVETYKALGMLAAAILPNPTNIAGIRSRTPEQYPA
jgi:hypothetical protein